MKTQLTRALLDRMPDLKPMLAERYVSKYVAAVMQEIAEQSMLMTSDDLEAGEMSFGANSVSLACGRMKENGEAQYIFTVMQAHVSTSLVIVTYPGNSISKRVSRVTFNPNYKKSIIEEIINLTIEINPKYLKELQAKANYDIDVDVPSLESFINATRRAIDHAPNKNYEAKVVRNLQIANQLLA